MKPVVIVKADTVTLRYQLTEDGVAKDITGMTFKLAVKEKLSDVAFKIDPVDGDIDDAATGKFSFTLTDSETDQDPFAGKMEIAMFSGTDKTTLTPAGGIGFRLVEDVIT